MNGFEAWIVRGGERVAVSSQAYRPPPAAPLLRSGARCRGTGGFRYWGKIRTTGEIEVRVLRVVTLEDGEKIHNAFVHRAFREEGR